MIPDRLPSEASAGEKKVFAALQGLPEDCIVYYEPVVGRRYPDFVVIMPSIGVLVIEAKGWRPGQIQSATTHDVEIDDHGRLAKAKHPIRQARDYMNALMNTARELPATDRLLHRSGSLQGRFVFPFGHMVVLNNCSRAQLDERKLSVVFPSAKVMTRDELESFVAAPPESNLERLKAYFDPWWPFPVLAERQVDAIRVMVHPEVLVKLPEPPLRGVAEAPLLFSHEKQDILSELKALDLRQERSARSLGDGHRVIYGVAGSGKTVILVARARLVAQDSRRKVLLLCFNRTLAEKFRQAFTGVANVACYNFHGWGAAQGVKFDPAEDEDAYGTRLLTEMREGRRQAGAYDAVFVDEAQDFALTWFQCAKAALKEPDDGDLLIVGDGTQSLYRRRRFSWAEAGVHAQGRTISRRLDLDRNYRNTRQILELAAGFAMIGLPAQESAEHALPAFCPDPRTALREGPVPETILSTDMPAVVASKIAQWVHVDGIAPSMIGVMYRANINRGIDLLANVLGGRFPLNWRQGPTGKPEYHDPSGVTLTTIHSAKGLQWRAVVIVDADAMPLLPEGLDQAKEADALTQIERSLMYVALTRAADRLVVTCRSSNGFAGELMRIGREINIRADVGR